MGVELRNDNNAAVAAAPIAATPPAIAATPHLPPTALDAPPARLAPRFAVRFAGAVRVVFLRVAPVERVVDALVGAPQGDPAEALERCAAGERARR